MPRPVESCDCVDKNGNPWPDCTCEHGKRDAALAARDLSDIDGNGNQGPDDFNPEPGWIARIGKKAEGR